MFVNDFYVNGVNEFDFCEISHTRKGFQNRHSERCHYVTWVFLVAIILNVLCNVLPSVYCSLKAIMSPLSGKSCGMWRGREFCTEWEP